jgi:hypothetical protein
MDAITSICSLPCDYIASLTATRLRAPANIRAGALSLLTPLTTTRLTRGYAPETRERPLTRSGDVIPQTGRRESPLGDGLAFTALTKV